MADPSAAARLNRLPLTRSHRIATVITGVGTFFDLFYIFVDTYLSELLPVRERGRYTVYAYTSGFLECRLLGFWAGSLLPLQPLGLRGRPTA